MIYEATSGAVNSGYTTSSTLRSFSFWIYKTGDGENSVGRMFDKRDAAASQVEVFYFNGITFTFERQWNVTNGVWNIDILPNLGWRHVVITYDSSAVADRPLVYVDGKSVTVTEQTPAAGTTPTNNASAYWIGNRGDDDRTWQGNIADFRIYEIILSPTQVAEMYSCYDSPAISTGLAVQFPMWDFKTQYDVSTNGKKGTVSGNTIPSQSGPPLTLCNGGSL